jgi:hypothetical protein
VNLVDLVATRLQRSVNECNRTVIIGEPCKTQLLLDLVAKADGSWFISVNQKIWPGVSNATITIGEK